MKKSIIALMLMYSCYLNAQIEFPNQVLTNCDFIILPEIEGTGLSMTLYYYEGALSDNVYYYPGDTIHSTTQLFAYDEVNGWEECLLINIILNIPIIIMNDTIWSCNIGMLPKPEGQFITVNATYHKTNEYLNPALYPGNTIEELGWYYLRDGYENCFVYDSIYIAIAPPVFIEDIGNIQACQEYVISEFSSFTTGKDIKFKDDFGNTYITGDTITETTILTIISSNEACSFSRRFRVSLFDGDFEDLADSTYCDKPIYYNPLSKYHYLPGFEESYIKVSTGDFSTTFIVNYDWADGNCVYQDSFTIRSGNISNFPGCIPDTGYLCNIGDINLNQYIKNNTNFLPSDIQWKFYLTSGEQITNTINTEDFFGDTLDIYFHALSIPECFDSTHIFKSTFIVNEECILNDQIDTLYCSSLGGLNKDNYQNIPHGTRLYDSNFNLVQNYKDVVAGSNIYYYIIELVDGTRDTSTHFIELFEEIEIYPPITEFGELCYKDCIAINYENIDIDLADTTQYFVFWGVSLFSASDSQYIESFLPFNGFLTICFDDLTTNPQENIGYVALENHNYYMVFNEFSSTNFCIENNEPDTVYFSTLSNTSRNITNILCPDEEFIILDDTFNIDRPYDELIIENAAANGCDSIIIVDLEYDNSSYRKIDEIHCDTNQILFINCELFDFSNPSGLITLENASSNGCDSIVEINLTFIAPEIIQNSISFCEGDTVYHLGSPVYESASFLDTLYSDFGCDSIINETNFLLIAKAVEILFESAFDCTTQTYAIDFLEIYPFHFIDDVQTTNNIISDINQNEITVSYGNEQECLTYETIEFQYPSNWEILVDDFTDISTANEVVLGFDTELSSPLIQWTPSDILSCSDCPAPTLLVKHDTTILLQLIDEFGCSKEQTITITFQNNNTCAAPNVISRSAKVEKNRSFHLVSSNPINYDLTIYDRWGSQIHTVENIQSNDIQSGWTPTSNFEIGVYVYFIKFHDIDKKEIVGTVLLLD